MKTGFINKKFETKKVYIALSLFTLAAVTLAILISNGHLFQVFFFPDPDDTGMDFFNSLIDVHTREPYGKYEVIYPPFANLFFYVLTLFIPDSVKAGWPANHEAVKGIVGTREDLRLTQSAILLFLFFLILTLFGIAVMIHRETKSYPLTFCLVLSAGMLIGLERGNVVLLAFLLTFFFVKHYNDENRITSELALLALAAAFGFKLFPCVFGILLLKDRKFAAAGRAVLYAVLFTVLPTFLFGGPSCLLTWFELLTGYGNVATTSSSGSSGFPVPLNLVLAAGLLIILLVIFFAQKNGKPLLVLKHSQILFLTAYLSLLVNEGAGGYNLVFFLIPFLAFLQEEKTISRYNCIEFLVYLVALLPAGINQITYLFFFLYLAGCGCRILASKKSGKAEN